MEEKRSYKEFILNHPATLFAGSNISLLDLLVAKYLYEMYRDFQSSVTTGFVIEISDILSDDVRKVLEDHNIKIGDIIYLDFNEDYYSYIKNNKITKTAKENAKLVLTDGDFSMADRVKRVKEILKFRGCPDYQIGKMDYNLNDDFFINDSIASKIIGSVYTVPEMVLKPNFVQNNDSEQVKTVRMKFEALKHDTKEELRIFNKCLMAVEKYYNDFNNKRNEDL